jgi:hypothetical protein
MREYLLFLLRGKSYRESDYIANFKRKGENKIIPVILLYRPLSEHGHTNNGCNGGDGDNNYLLGPQISITAISARMLVSKCRYFTTKLVRCSIIWVNRLTRLEMISNVNE